MTDKTYCYPPDYTVLKNKAGFRDPEKLEQFERLYTQSRMMDCPLDLPITYVGYQAIHRHVFQDVYEWAGQSRTVTIHKGDAFANWMYVDQEMEKRFELIRQDQNLQSSSAVEFAEKAAEHLSEINAIHPFREGNGRTQRLFLRNLAHQAGHESHIARIDKDRWMDASIEGFREQNYEPMAKLIYSCMEDRPRSRDRHRDDHGR